jgi:hypothetical protein
MAIDLDELLRTRLRDLIDESRGRLEDMEQDVLRRIGRHRRLRRVKAGCAALAVLAVVLVMPTVLGDRSSPEVRTTINCGPVYVRGDRLLWFADATGRVHADVSIPMSRGANIGDPSMTHVDVYDVNGVPSRCPGCDLRMYGSKVEIRDGVIWGAEVLLYEPPSDLHAVVWDPVTGKESQRLSAFKPLGVLPWPS